jgi:hypothetical protein
MEHFVAFERGDRPRTSLESTGRLSISGGNPGHLLGALNNKVWVVRGAREGGRLRIELYGVCVVAAISEATSGEFVLEGVDTIDFEPPVVLNEETRSGTVGHASWAKLRAGLTRIRDASMVERLEEIEHRARTERRRAATHSRDHAARGASERDAARREFSHAQREKIAVQNRAMACALEYYRHRWKTVDDVSSHEAYEIRCDDPKGRTLAVTVKGTTGGWENLLLTAAEERHAREAYPDVALFILHEIGIAVGPDGELVGRGGATHVIDPWDISVDELSPLIFGCRVARSRMTKHGSR